MNCGRFPITVSTLPLPACLSGYWLAHARIQVRGTVQGVVGASRHLLWYLDWQTGGGPAATRSGRSGLPRELTRDAPPERRVRRPATGPGACGRAMSSTAAIGMTSRTVEAMNASSAPRTSSSVHGASVTSHSSSSRRRVIESRIPSDSGGVCRRPPRDPEERPRRALEHAAVRRDEQRLVGALLLRDPPGEHVRRVRERLEAVQHARGRVGDRRHARVAGRAGSGSPIAIRRPPRVTTRRSERLRLAVTDGERLGAQRVEVDLQPQARAGARRAARSARRARTGGRRRRASPRSRRRRAAAPRRSPGSAPPRPVRRRRSRWRATSGPSLAARYRRGLVRLVEPAPNVELRADRHGHAHVVFAFPYRADIVDAVRAIPGRRFDWDAKEWWAPQADSTAPYVKGVIERYPGAARRRRRDAPGSRRRRAAGSAASSAARLDGRGAFVLETISGELPDELAAVGRGARRPPLAPVRARDRRGAARAARRAARQARAALRDEAAGRPGARARDARARRQRRRAALHARRQLGSRTRSPPSSRCPRARRTAARSRSTPTSSSRSSTTCAPTASRSPRTPREVLDAAAGRARRGDRGRPPLARPRRPGARDRVGARRRAAPVPARRRRVRAARAAHVPRRRAGPRQDRPGARGARGGRRLPRRS